MKRLYIYIDDSGVMHKNDKYIVYGGILFFSLNEIELLNKKINYQKEIKYNKLGIKHKRIIFHKIKNNILFGVIIKNENINNCIMSNTKSKGRYKDYAHKILIKNIVLYLIKNKIISRYDKLYMEINIDESNIKSNACRSLKGDIYNELINGTYNYRYNIKYNNILYNTLNIKINYLKSGDSFGIMIADFIAGQIRYDMYNKNSINYLKIKKIIP